VAVGEAITAKDKEDEDEEDKELAKSLAKSASVKDKATKKPDAMDTDEPEEAADAKGVPQFWLTALRNHPQLQASITERDEEALAHLSDVRYV
jgi:nucleosome assembly protein 1-like 1